MTPPRLSVLLLGIAGALLPACRRADVIGPPTIRLGRDECGDCGMLVSEERCSSAVLIADEGDRSHLVFDDIGCMLDYIAEHPGAPLLGTFVHDYGTGQWLGADSAHFIASAPDGPRTPMGSGMVAFRTREAAEQRAAPGGGRTLNYVELVKARADWREGRRAQPAGGP